MYHISRCFTKVLEVILKFIKGTYRRASDALLNSLKSLCSLTTEPFTDLISCELFTIIFSSRVELRVAKRLSQSSYIEDILSV